MSKLIILTGLPGSGKSTYAEKLEKELGNALHLSSDAVRKELYGDESIQTDPNKVFRILHHRVKSSLIDGKTVIYDATNVTRKSRKTVIGVANSVQAEIECHIVWAPVDTCIERDKNRSRTVGWPIIKKFLYSWQTPYFDEGIKVIKIVNTDLNHNIESYAEKLSRDMSIPHDNPHHKLDIDEHCLEAFSYLLKNNEADMYVRTAALFHDVGKPMTKFFKDDGTAHYYQHDCVGGYLSYGLWTTEEFDTNTNLLLIVWLINNHMQPYFNSSYYKGLNKDLKQKVDILHEADKAAH